MAILTPRRQKFVEEYLVDLNATQAVIRAGYSPNGARVQGVRLLTNDNVQDAIRELRAKDSEKVGVTRERTLEEYRRVAYGDSRAVMTWGPGGMTIIESKELTDEEADMVSEVSDRTTQTGRTIQIKLHDRLRALDGIRKMEGYDAPVKTVHTGADGGPIGVIVFEPAEKGESE